MTPSFHFKTCLVWRAEIPPNKIHLFTSSHDAPRLKSTFLVCTDANHVLNKVKLRIKETYGGHHHKSEDKSDPD